MSKKNFKEIADVYRNFDSPTTVTLGVLWAEKHIAELEANDLEALMVEYGITVIPNSEDWRAYSSTDLTKALWAKGKTPGEAVRALVEKLGR